MPAPIPIAAELLSSSDDTVTQEVDNAINHFCFLFGNVDWLKTGRMTFYKKWNSIMHDLTMYFTNCNKFQKFQNFHNFNKILIFK